MLGLPLGGQGGQQAQGGLLMPMQPCAVNTLTPVVMEEAGGSRRGQS